MFHPPPPTVFQFLACLHPNGQPEHWMSGSKVVLVPPSYEKGKCSLQLDLSSSHQCPNMHGMHLFLKVMEKVGVIWNFFEVLRNFLLSSLIPNLSLDESTIAIILCNKQIPNGIKPQALISCSQSVGWLWPCWEKLENAGLCSKLWVGFGYTSQVSSFYDQHLP